MGHAGDGSERLFVVEQAGRILIVDAGELLAEPFLDISEEVSSGGERGLLGLAFHPEFAANGRYFVHYTRAEDGASVIAEFRVSRDPNRSRRAGRALLTVSQPFANHNGGMIAFGPDGFLYIALGDGGSRGDPGNRAQNPNVLLGKILRIDVDGRRPYAIPPTIRSSQAAVGRRSMRLACVTPGASPSTATEDGCTLAMSARGRGRRSTSSGTAATTAGGCSRAAAVSSRPRAASAAASSCRAPNTATGAAAAR